MTSAPDPTMTEAALKKMTIPQLKALCKEKGLSGYSKATKGVIVDKLLGWQLIVGAQKDDEDIRRDSESVPATGATKPTLASSQGPANAVKFAGGGLGSEVEVRGDVPLEDSCGGDVGGRVDISPSPLARPCVRGSLGVASVVRAVIVNGMPLHTPEDLRLATPGLEFGSGSMGRSSANRSGGDHNQDDGQLPVLSELERMVRGPIPGPVVGPDSEVSSRVGLAGGKYPSATINAQGLAQGSSTEAKSQKASVDFKRRLAEEEKEDGGPSSNRQSEKRRKVATPSAQRAGTNGPNSLSITSNLSLSSLAALQVQVLDRQSKPFRALVTSKKKGRGVLTDQSLFPHSRKGQEKPKEPSALVSPSLDFSTSRAMAFESCEIKFGIITLPLLPSVGVFKATNWKEISQQKRLETLVLVFGFQFDWGRIEHRQHLSRCCLTSKEVRCAGI